MRWKTKFNWVISFSFYLFICRRLYVNYWATMPLSFWYIIFCFAKNHHFDMDQNFKEFTIKNWLWNLLKSLLIRWSLKRNLHKDYYCWKLLWLVHHNRLVPKRLFDSILVSKHLGWLVPIYWWNSSWW